MIATEILQRYQAGASMSTLMDEYHIQHGALRHILVSMGATIRPSGMNIQVCERPVSVKDEILQRYQAGDSQTILVHDYHIGKHTLRRLLLTMGATIRPSGKDSATLGPAQVKEEILARYQGGASFETLKHEYHIGKDSLRRLLVDMGATIRPARVPVHLHPPSHATQQRGRETQERIRAGRRASEGRCQRCEILLAEAPTGDAGMCGYCVKEDA